MASSDANSPFLRLSNEVIEMVFSSPLLDHKDMASLACVCTRFAEISGSKELWRRKCIERWWSWSIATSDGSLNWREIYRERLFWENRIYSAVRDLSALNFNQEDISLDTMHRFDEIFDEYNCFPEAARLGLEEIRKSPAKMCDLTMKYYTDHVCEYLKVRQIEESMKALLRQPREEIDLEDGALLLSQWQNLWTSVDCNAVKTTMDAMADRVRECLEDQLQTSLSSEGKQDQLATGGTGEDPGPNAICKQFPVMDILNAMNHVMFHEFKFSGNVIDYYNPDNSYLDKVVEHRTGLPITLSILYIGLGKRLGIKLDPFGVPHHFVVHGVETASDGHGVDVFIDVFDGGKLMGSKGYKEYFDESSIHCPIFGKAAPNEVFSRMARNLLNFYQNSFIVDKSAVIRNLLHLIHVVQPRSVQNTAILCRINAHLRINGRQTLAMLNTVQGHLQADEMKELTEVAQAIVAESCEPPEANAKKRSHPNHLNVMYRVGMVMKHKHYDYLCVIYGWDPVCRLSASWQMQMGVNLLPHKNMQPFYSVLADDCSLRYAAQESLEISPSELVKANLHPKVGKYFSAFDGFRYIPNVELAKRYPEDL